MKLELKRIFDIVSESLVVEDVVDLSAVKLSGGILPFEKPVCVKALVKNRAGVVTLDLSVSFNLALECDRCLTRFERDFSIDSTHILVLELNGEDTGEYIICPEAVLNLDELVRDDVVLQLPMVMLCREDCKGLCGKCGTDLNQGSCACRDEDIDPRLSALKQLLEN